MTLTIKKYEEAFRESWDKFVHASKNGTFLFLRDYMEYHNERFHDHSLVVLDGDRLVAAMPANILDSELHSHQGLSYGGFITSSRMTTPLMLETFSRAIEYLSSLGIKGVSYKTVPPIYHSLPAEEDRYALFLRGAELNRRDVLSVVPHQRAADVQTRRRRGLAKAMKLGINVTRSSAWDRYWQLLASTLDARYGVEPVHSLQEIELLWKRFPNNISLHVAERQGELLAGVVIYESQMVAHAQYIATSATGRDTGALDRLFFHLLNDTFAEKPYFDFGISNEQRGRVLNHNLIEQKEGFGARAIVHDFYALRF